MAIDGHQWPSIPSPAGQVPRHKLVAGKLGVTLTGPKGTEAQRHRSGTAGHRGMGVGEFMKETTPSTTTACRHGKAWE